MQDRLDEQQRLGELLAMRAAMEAARDAQPLIVASKFHAAAEALLGRADGCDGRGKLNE